MTMTEKQAVTEAMESKYLRFWGRSLTHNERVESSGVARKAFFAGVEAALAQAQAKPVEVLDNAGDAERWRALLRCARINVWGSAGFDPKTGKRQQYSNATGEYEDRSDGWVHFGAEFWSIWPGAEDPDPETRWGTVALKALADDVLLKERETAAPEPKP